MSSSAPSSQPRWILSFADMLSVVLSFLVLAYSMSLPAQKKERFFGKEGGGAFSVHDSRHSEDIAIAQNNQDLSTNYLQQVTEKKIKANPELVNKIVLKAQGDSLVMTVDTNDFISVAPSLTQMLKVMKNDIWIYAANIDTCRNAYNELNKNGFSKNVTLIQSDLAKTQIDIVVHP